jgi:signal transduction histidine kinase
MEDKEIIEHYKFLIGFVAHEVKNPVHIIGMFADMMLEGSYGPLAEKQKTVLEAIRFNANRLEHMAADFLNLSLIESGEIRIETEPLDLRRDLLEPVVMNLGHKFRDMGVSLVDTLASAPEAMLVTGNRNLLTVVFDNLLFNALKYGKKGGAIGFSAERSGDKVAIAIRNEGSGVPKEKLPLLFRKFSRVIGEEHRDVKGTGLGLYNVKRIVELHGGEIFAESEFGKDFTVRFTLPAAG